MRYTTVMAKRDKILAKIMGGKSDANIPFEGTITLLLSMGFSERVSGSHHNFSKEGIPELIDIQKTKEGKVKPYQVKQMREVFRKHGLA